MYCIYLKYMSYIIKDRIKIQTKKETPIKFQAIKQEKKDEQISKIQKECKKWNQLIKFPVQSPI